MIGLLTLLLLPSAFAADSCIRYVKPELLGKPGAGVALSSVYTDFDRGAAILTESDTSFAYVDLTTGKKRTFKKASNELAYFTGDNIIAFLTQDAIARFYQASPAPARPISMRFLNMNTGKVWTESGSEVYQGGVWKPQGEAKDGIRLLVNARGEKRWVLERRERAYSDTADRGEPNYRVNPDGSVDVRDPTSDGPTETYTFGTEGEQGSSGVLFGSKEKLVVARNGLIYVVDRATKERITIGNKDQYISNYISSSRMRSQNISRDGNKMVASAGSDSVVIDLKTGKFTKLPEGLTSMFFAHNGDACGIVQVMVDRPMLKCFDPKTGAETHAAVTGSDRVPFLMADGSTIQVREQHIERLRQEKICPKALPNPEEARGCELPPAELGTEAILKFAGEARCALPYQPSLWPPTAPDAAGGVSGRYVQETLARFSKPGGFGTDGDLDQLYLVLMAGATKRFPAETRAATLGVMNFSPDVYESILMKFPELASIKAAPSTACLTAEEQKLIAKKAISNARERILDSPGQEVSRAKRLAPLITPFLSSEEKNKLTDEIAEKAVSYAGGAHDTRNIFPYKVHIFAKNALDKALGEASQEFSDIAVTREGDTLEPKILSTTKVDDFSVDTGLGFYLRSVTSEEIKDLPLGLSEQKIEWEQGGQTYRALLEYERPRETRKVIPEGKSPDYASLWKNNQLRGLVIIGANMETNVTDRTVNQYLAYYLKEGFKFEKPALTNDLPALLKERVEGKEPAQYFIKEAHSDGDEQNLFELYKKAKVIRGKRVRNGRTENVEIAFSLEDGPKEKLANEVFGRWLQKREKDGGGQFVYLNSSCWSVSKAIQEISAAYSPVLLNIASPETMDFFADKRSNVMRTVVDGLRNKRSYEEMRKGMEADAEYRAKTSNVFLFPDDQEYEEKIGSKLTLPIRTTPKLYKVDAEGKEVPFSIDD